MFKDLFQEVFDSEFRADFDAAGLTYEHRLYIGDMVAQVMKWEGGYVWACKNYDGDVQSDTIAQGFGSLGLMTSVLMASTARPSRPRPLTAPSRATIREHQKERQDLHQPDRLDLRLDRRTRHRGKLDATPEVTRFAETLEQVCVEAIEAGQGGQGSRPAGLPRRPVPVHRGLSRRPRPPPPGRRWPLLSR